MEGNEVLWSYLIGSVVTWVLVSNAYRKQGIEATIDSLVENGFLRHRKQADGEIEILKWNDLDSTKTD